jgi:hypothetical protein
MDTQDTENSGSTRRGRLKRMAWAGTGIVCALATGLAVANSALTL